LIPAVHQKPKQASAILAESAVNTFTTSIRLTPWNPFIFSVTSNNLKVAHLSRVRGTADGGISIIVDQLLQAQRKLISGTSEVTWFTPPQSLSAEINIFKPDLLHVHGLWRAPNRLLPFRRSLPNVISPQGMLDPWALSQHRKRKSLLWHAFEHANLDAASAIHAVSASELQVIRSLSISSPIAVVPNGINIPLACDGTSQPPPWPTDGRKVLLFLSRLHSKKGIIPLLKAWSAISTDAIQAGWSLEIVGYAADRPVQQVMASTTIPGVRFHPPCFDQFKYSAFRNASAFILPSFSEGLPMAALEAMSFGLPCLLSSACNIEDAFTAEAALSAEPEPTLLERSLRTFLFEMTSIDHLRMGSNALELVSRHYTWPSIAEMLLLLYSWILDGKPKPYFVY
jgi:glycosyltransferase involved in cell wall biosynthesis